MSTPSDPRTSIRRFLAENFLLTDKEFPYPDEASLLELGVVDSTGVLELIQFLESTFDIEVSDADAVPDNLDSVARMLAFVGQKQVS
jgi:acyl carrier protein